MTYRLVHTLFLTLLGAMILWPFDASAQPAQPMPVDEHSMFAPPGMFGPPPGGPGPGKMGEHFEWSDMMERWMEHDRRMLKTAKKFAEIEAQREKLLEDLTKEKSRYEPGRMDTQAVLSRQKVNSILAELHKLVEQDRKNLEEAVRLFGFTAMSIRFWGPAMKKQLENEDFQLAPNDAKRMSVWVEAYEKTQSEGPEALATTLLGEDFGTVVHHTAREQLEKMMREGRMDRGSRSRRGPGGPFMKDSQRRWIGRIQRMEKRQEELQEQLDGLDQELARLRRMIQSEASWAPDDADEHDATSDKE